MSNAPTNELFGYVPKTKAAPAGYTPFVPEGCGLLVNKESGGGGGLTWADCDDEDEPVLVPVSYEKIIIKSLYLYMFFRATLNDIF